MPKGRLPTGRVEVAALTSVRLRCGGAMPWQGGGDTALARHICRMHVVTSRLPHDPEASHIISVDILMLAGR